MTEAAGEEQGAETGKRAHPYKAGESVVASLDRGGGQTVKAGVAAKFDI